MTEPIIRVQAGHLGLGDTATQDLRPGQFVVVCAEPLYVAEELRYLNGTVVITLKRRPAGGAR